MMRKKTLVGGAALVAILALAVVGWAIERGPWSHGFAGHEHGDLAAHMLAMLDNEHFRSAMNLTAQEADRLRQIIVNTEKSTIKTKAALEVNQIDLRELLRADNPDRAAVLKKVQDISSLRGEMMKAHIEALLEAKSVLTPEQQKKLREFFESRHGREFMRGRAMQRGQMSCPCMREGGMPGPAMEHQGMPGPPPAPAAPPKPPAE
jgi:Spy/CpxP family protein refolding chaperone